MQSRRRLDQTAAIDLDAGEGKTRNVFSIAKYVPTRRPRWQTHRTGRQPRAAQMKFGISEGMVLAASAKDGSDNKGIYIPRTHRRREPGMRDFIKNSRQNRKKHRNVPCTNSMFLYYNFRPFAGLAHLQSTLTCNQGVVGSSPATGINAKSPVFNWAFYTL